ncbi:metal-dependent hydrolase [Candidatus Micrarchaeota archaeon]|nr:metal-dependent hydrolase [Candidatus Micrarchaeota archaeon]
MPFTLIHGLIAFLIVSVFTKNPKLRLLAFVFGMLPDLDGIGLFFDLNLYYEFHHELFHQPAYGIILGVIFALILSERFKLDKLKSFTVISFSFILHSVTDVFFTAWPVKLFWPFSSQNFSYPFLIEFNWLLALIVFAVFIIQVFVVEKTKINELI